MTVHAGGPPRPGRHRHIEPAGNSCFCDDLTLAARTRVAESRELVIPARWPGHGAAGIRQDGDAFAIAAWAGFPRG